MSPMEEPPEDERHEIERRRERIAASKAIRASRTCGGCGAALPESPRRIGVVSKCPRCGRRT
jgi:hypothetical protein